MMKYRVIKKLANKEGFSLIELMIALTIFAIGILALAQLQSSAIVYNSEARRYTEATIIAQSKMDEFRTIPFINIDDETENIDSYTITTTVTVGPIDDTKSIDVVVSWVHKGNKTYSLQTIVGK